MIRPKSFLLAFHVSNMHFGNGSTEQTPLVLENIKLDDDYFLKLEPRTLFKKSTAKENRPAPPPGLTILKDDSLDLYGYLKRTGTGASSKEAEASVLVEKIPQPTEKPLILPKETASIPEQIPLNSATVFQDSLNRKDRKQFYYNLFKAVLTGVGLLADGYLMIHGIHVKGILTVAPEAISKASGILGFGIFQISDSVSKLLASDTAYSTVVSAMSLLKTALKNFLGRMDKTLTFSGSQLQPSREHPGVQLLNQCLQTLDKYQLQLEQAESHAQRMDIALKMEESLFSELNAFILQEGSESEKATVTQMNRVLLNYKNYTTALPPKAQTFADIGMSQRRQLGQILQEALESQSQPLIDWGRDYARTVGVSDAEMDAIILKSKATKGR